MGNRICEVCGGSHLRPVECAGDLRPTGPERPTWRVEVDTPRGIEAFGVLVAPSYDHFRARILTYPNVLWLGADGRTTLKFGGRTAREAEAGAIAFIESHCRSRGYQVRTALAPVTSAGSSLAAFLAAERQKPTAVAPRKTIAIPLRYGPVRPVDPGLTVNLSETGLFVGARRLLEPGSHSFRARGRREGGFAVIDNAVNGHGLRWNVAERVQVYTHPLWMLVLLPLYAITREPFFTTLALGAAFSLAAVGAIAWRWRDEPWTAAAAIVPLIVSRAFVDYSTSGLENPLTHLLLVAFVLLMPGDREPIDPRRMTLLGALTPAS